MSESSTSINADGKNASVPSVSAASAVSVPVDTTLTASTTAPPVCTPPNASTTTTSSSSSSATSTTSGGAMRVISINDDRLRYMNVVTNNRTSLMISGGYCLFCDARITPSMVSSLPTTDDSDIKGDDDMDPYNTAAVTATIASPSIPAAAAPAASPTCMCSRCYIDAIAPDAWLTSLYNELNGSIIEAVNTAGVAVRLPIRSPRDVRKALKYRGFGIDPSDAQQAASTSLPPM
jgi:hypothetical protein